MKINLAVYAPLILFTAFAGALFVGLNRDNPDELPTVFIDKQAPLIPAEGLADYPVPEQSVLMEPGFKLVNFWASWCPPCRNEHPNLMELADAGWTIIGVNKSDSEENATAFLNELGNPFASIGADPNGRGSIDWGVYGLPETFLIDGDGNIRYRFPGPLTKRDWNNRFVPIIESVKAGAGAAE